jgi:chitodextrinase
MAPATTATDGGLAPQTAHTYTVTAVDRAGNASAPSAVASARATTSVVPERE